MAEEEYTKTCESVAKCASSNLVDEVAESIKNHIRNEQERPNNQSVHRDARFLSRQRGNRTRHLSQQGSNLNKQIVVESQS